MANFFVVISRGKLFILSPLFSVNGLPLLGVVPTKKLSAIWIKEKVMSFTHLLKIKVCECGLIIIIMQHESFWLSEFVFYMLIKPHSHAAVFKLVVNGVNFSSI